MIKRVLAVFICIIMLASLLTAFTACGEDDGCYEMSEEDRLISDIKKINDMIRACCMDSVLITYDQLKTALASFYYVQEKYSGMLLREIEGVKYYCPHFILEWENRQSPDRENMMYIITPLPRNELEIYTGIMVTPYYTNETAAKIKEMNEKVAAFTLYTTNRNRVDEMIEKFKEFQKEYSGKLLCVDPVRGEIYCPEYELYEDKLTYGSDAYKDDIPYVVLWQCIHMSENKEGFIKGISVLYGFHDVDDDYVVQAGELVYFPKGVGDRNNLIPYSTRLHFLTPKD